MTIEWILKKILTKFAIKAKEGSNRFSSKKIAERWLEIL